MRGNKIYIQLENTSEDDQILNPKWEIGIAEVVEEEPNLPRMEIDEVGLPTVPEDLSPKKKKELEALLSEVHDVFAGKRLKLGNTPVIEHEIHQPYRRQNPEVRRQEQEQLKDMLKQEIVRPSFSVWGSPVVMVKKKDGTLRFCIDFQKLNDVTVKDAHPLPRIDDTLEALKGAKIFSTLDLKSGYWQVPIKEEHKSKTAFWTSSGQLFEFNRLPFGLCNALATFSRLMDNLLSGLSWEVCPYYLGLGAILAQQQEGKECIICCASRTLSKSEQNYSATKKECLAVVWGIKNFLNYLTANYFKAYTDHYCLQWLQSMEHESALLHHWAVQLEDYDFEVLHRPGKNQGHADALSRLNKDTINLLGADKTTLRTPEETKEVLQQLHEEGHLGLRKTLKLFRRRFLGVQEKTLCKEVISECLGCQLGSDYKPRDILKGKIESKSPWDILSIDTMGPFVARRKGKGYILSIIDCFSRYLILVPLHDHTATTVSCALYEHVIGYFSYPQKILSDRGTEFMGCIWTDLMELLGIQQLLTSPYYPQGNGIVERSHRTVNNMIRDHLVNRDDQGWVDILPGAMLAYNEMEQEQHGYSASQVMWGQDMNLPTDLLHGTRSVGEQDKH